MANGMDSGVAQELPPLPAPTGLRYWTQGHSARWQYAEPGSRHAPTDAEPLFSAAQMRDYARAALSAVAPVQVEPPNTWADLWYFVMDEAPMEFERIVTTYSPKVWHEEAWKLYRAKYPAGPQASPQGGQPVGTSGSGATATS